MRLLIADDQQSLHTFLDKMMDWKKLGITQVEHAFDGKETVELVKEFKPDILIIDIQMPFLNGIDTLKQLHLQSFQPKTLILSAYDEFEYAREALRLSVTQYLLKPVDTVQLEAAVEELIGEIKLEQHVNLETILESLLEQKSDEDKWRALSENAWRTCKLQSCSICIMSGQFANEGDVEPLFSKLDQLPEIIFAYPLHSQQVLVLVGWSHDIRHETLTQVYKDVVARFQVSYPERSIRIGASSLGTTWSELPELIDQSKQSMIEGFYGDQLFYIYSAEHKSKDGWTIQHYQHFNQAFEERFTHDFSSEMIKELISTLLRTFQELLLEPDEVYRLCTYYWSMAVQTMKREQRISAEHEAPSLEKLQQFITLHELGEYFVEQISELTIVPDWAALQVEEIIARIKQHIERNYGEELSLQYIAEQFGLDKYQLSRLYKQQYGINYWQYVTTVRLNKAAELLKGTTLKNSVIAELTGFVDESHLSKTFKKFFAVSPKEYRADKSSV